MKGIIEEVSYFVPDGGVKWVFICGDDGVKYFGHKTDFIKKSKHYKKGHEVTFDVVQTERAHPGAVNIDVEVPDRDTRKDDTLISIDHLRDGAIVKRIMKHTGVVVSMIIKDGRMILSCLPEYERDMIWIYQRGPSGK